MEDNRESKNIASPSDHTPVFHELDLLERYDKKLQLVKRVASKWKRVATRLYFSQETIDAISLDSHHQCDPACRTMFTRWLDGEGRGPKTWRTLIAALCEADLSSVAHELDEMISCTNKSESIGRERHRRICQVL